MLTHFDDAMVTGWEFAADTVDVNPLHAVAALKQIAARSHPRLSVDELLVLLRDRYGMDEAVELIAPYID